MPRTPRKNNGPNTREAILDAAEELFVDKGFSETSMSRIARKARVTKSLIHHHFGSKDNLWSEVKKRRFTQYSKSQFNLFSKKNPDVDDVQDAMKQYFQFLKKNPGFVRLILWSIIEHDSQQRHLQDKLSIVGVEMIRQAQKSGSLRSDVDPRSLMIMIYGLVLNWFQAKHEYLQWLGIDTDTGIEDDDYLADVVKILFGGVLSNGEKD
jgi:TetR/AcrR family transcriptional regulator